MQELRAGVRLVEEPFRMPSTTSQRNLWVTDTFEWRWLVRVAQPTNPMPDSKGAIVSVVHVNADYWTASVTDAGLEIPPMVITTDCAPDGVFWDSWMLSWSTPSTNVGAEPSNSTTAG